MSPFDVTLSISIFVLGFYALNGIRLFDSKQDFDTYFLANRTLNKANVRNTFAGAAISISTVLSFFLTLGVLFGFQVLWSPFTLVLGVVAFAHGIYPRIVRRGALASALRGETETPVDSLGDLVFHLYGSRSLAGISVFLSAVGVFAILVAEMMVGVTIYERYFLQPQYLVFVIAITLFLYAAFGGIRAVVETDKWQLRLIVVGLAVVAIVLYIQEAGTTNKPTPGFSDVFDWSTWTPTMVMPMALWANMLLVNLTFLPSSLRVWQVVVAASKESNFRVALWQATVVIVVVSILSVVISRVMLGLLGEPPQLSSIFAYLADPLKPIMGYLVYPLLIVAMLSALVSTADSAILPLAQLMAGSKARWKVARGYSSVGAILSGSVVLYFIVTTIFDLTLVSWILTVFSITTCITPVVVCPLFMANRHFTPLALRVIEIGVLAGFAAAFSWSVMFGNDIAMQPWNCAIGLLVSTTTTLAGFALSPVKELPSAGITISRPEGAR